MKKSLVGVVAVLAALFAVVVPTTSATAVEDPYPDTVCTMVISPWMLKSGETFTVTVRSDLPMDLSIAVGEGANAVTRSKANATELVETFRARQVSQIEVERITGTCGDAIRDGGVIISPDGGGTGDDAVAGDGAGDGPGGNTVAGDGPGGNTVAGDGAADGPGGNTVAGDGAADGPGGNTVAGDGDSAGDGPGGNTVAGDGDAAGDGQGGDGDSAGDGDVGNNGDSDAPPLGPGAGTQDQGPEGQGFLGGILPNTGGPAWWLLLLALILLAAGTAVVARHRRA